ncbi:hypothetical protein SEA_VINCENZO_66 [Mycobacterium phage Vincenzo]|uniref:Uncharacterized protein n=2 Tax=Coopervirus vincenzo TaxID=1983110 RepID=A0A0F6WDX4_9CAUD|nr:hypothetical protein SEA_VINCENZO_66 [Mycobacterium phage Vincenzo]AKF14328.1 hypothetical protein SEA_VINCENZO_66 [Mycobacterium phage Vincenzo]AKF14732.1 hypothetical protein SEA_ALANGRANT_67 [Mycobacterium phage AlanGrant]
MTPWTLPPWQVALMRTIGALPDKAQLVAAMPRQYGHRLRGHRLIRTGQRRG